jgi:tetratricopeptide (TPR) repeat protein
MNARASSIAALSAVPPGDPAALLRAATAALGEGAASEVEAVLAAAAQTYPGDPRIWQFLALARRDLQDSAGAHDAFSRAAALAPNDPLIAHGQARAALEAGYPALPLFNRARLLAPGDGSVALGRAASQFAEGLGAQACEQLAAMLATNPGWVDGHLAYARFLAQVHPGAALDGSVTNALRQHPRAGALWQARMRILMEARDYPATLAAVGEARQALGPAEELDRIAALCLTELGRAAEAQALFDRLPFPANPEQAIWPIRNYIRLGRYDQALLLAEHDFDGQSAAPLWPYRSLLWRLLGDPRWHWLEGDERMIGTFDIAAEVGSLDRLAEVLRALHAAKGQPLDQSVRGGTQTDGNLLARAEPEIRTLRAALMEAVRSYVGQLPPPDPAHPMLFGQRDDLRVAGAWSVRLTDHGFHADHVHYQGWISSAFYVVVPEADPLDPEAGWLAFGQCQDVLPDLPAFRMVKPEPGKLALFPSIMWHGTRPFGSGERMTVAYDIARPRQA